jgi:hypothetical protein
MSCFPDAPVTGRSPAVVERFERLDRFLAA